jgi:hypothetical protein
MSSSKYLGGEVMDPMLLVFIGFVVALGALSYFEKEKNLQ